MLQGKDKFALTLMNATQIMEIVFPILYVLIAQVPLNVVSVSEDLWVIKKLDAQIGEFRYRYFFRKITTFIKVCMAPLIEGF